MADSNETRELISVRDLILIGGGGREKGEGDGHLTSEEEGSGEMPFSSSQKKTGPLLPGVPNHSTRQGGDEKD